MKKIILNGKSVWVTQHSLHSPMCSQGAHSCEIVHPLRCLGSQKPTTGLLNLYLIFIAEPVRANSAVVSLNGFVLPSFSNFFCFPAAHIVAVSHCLLLHSILPAVTHVLSCCHMLYQTPLHHHMSDH